MGKRPVGRPKSPLDLPDGWQDKLLDMYRNGAADIEIIAQIHDWREKFSRDLFYRWLDEEPEFSDTIKRGRELAEAVWTREGRENLKDKDFSYVGWYMNMKNRYGWRDKQEIENKNIDITQEYLDAVTKLANAKNPETKSESTD